MTIASSTDVAIPERSWPALLAGVNRAAVLDHAERLLVLLFYAQMVFRLVRDAIVLHNPMAMMLLPSEGLVIALILLRKPAQELSQRWRDWGAAVAATAAPTLVVATAPHGGPALVGLAACLTLMGLIVQIHAKLALGRSLGMVAANRGIRVGGPYQWVRHPMYLGYTMSFIAFVAMNWSIWNLFLLALVCTLQVYRMLAEERLLRQDSKYQQYEARVRWRVVPGLF